MYRKAPEMVKFAAIFGSNRYLVPLNGGIATPVCALARNDSFFQVRTCKQQFVGRVRITDGHAEISCVLHKTVV